MKTTLLHQLERSLFAMLVAILLFPFMLQGQTYRILKASNDPGAYANRAEVSAVLNATELNTFNFFRVTSKMVGAISGQEVALIKIPGTAQRTHSSVTDFNAMGAGWITANPNIKVVALDIDNTAELDMLPAAVGILGQTTGVQYLILQTTKDLYPTIDPSLYETTGLDLVEPKISGSLGFLFGKSIRVFFKAVDYK